MIRPMNKPGVGERSCADIPGSIQPLTAKFQRAHCVSKARVKDPAAHGSEECRGTNFRLSVARPQALRCSACAALFAQMVADYAERAAKGFGCAPEQLVAHRERAQKHRPERKLANAADRNVESSGHSGGCEAMESGFFVVGDHANPGIRLPENLLDF